MLDFRQDAVPRQFAKWALAGFAILVLIITSQKLSSQDYPSFSLKDLGEMPYVNFEHYGRFENIGENNFQYSVTDEVGLSKAVGVGVFPNVTGLISQKNYERLVASKALDGPLEDYYPDLNPELAFYKWGLHKPASNKGLKYYIMARALELGGHPEQALKAYYSVFINFPKDVVWQKNGPWYIGMSALDSVYGLLERHPGWKIDLEGASIRVENGFDNKTANDVFSIHPGKWVFRKHSPNNPIPLSGVQRWMGSGSVRFARHENGHWQLYVKDKPFIIRGVCYLPNPIGVSPDWGYRVHSEWMLSDMNGNGRVDGPYDAWVDKNRNNMRDDFERAVGDFQLMKEMGVNTIRLYHHSENNQLLRELKNKFGIGVIMGDYLGAYTLGSEASWDDGTDYGDPVQLEKMKQSVMDMVLAHKDEPYILMWMLGNENNYGSGNNANKKPAEFYSFANSMARMIKKLDPKHPIALCNGDIGNLDLISELCPDIDVLGINSYRGRFGFGRSFWAALKRYWDKPVLISEFGCPAYTKKGGEKVGAQKQAEYLLGSWKDIMNHTAGHDTGLAIGGVIFEWLDEWWKAGPQYGVWIHDEQSQMEGPFPDGHMYEEWLGICGQGNGDHSPFMRQLRPAYDVFRKGPWREKMPFMPAVIKGD